MSSFSLSRRDVPQIREIVDVPLPQVQKQCHGVIECEQLWLSVLLARDREPELVVVSLPTPTARVSCVCHSTQLSFRLSRQSLSSSESVVILWVA